MAMITDANVYFTDGCGRCARFGTPDCSTKLWHDGLLALRKLCLESGLVETAKWGHPCYMHAGRNIALFGAFRGDYRLTFFNAALLKDPEGLLKPAGPNAQVSGTLFLTDNGQVETLAPTISAYLREAMDYAEAGTLPPKIVTELEMPEELVEALDSDPELAEAFHELTPGRQKSYIYNLNSAKKSETRVSRIAGFRDKIIAGKGALDR